jgi:hypothetical protein
MVALVALAFASLNLIFHNPLLVQGLIGLIADAFPGSILVVYGFGLSLVMIAYETVLLRLFGATLGKALMGLSVRGPKGVTPGYLRALHRTALLCVVGLALNLPFVIAVTAFAAYARLKRRGDTFWDEAAETVVYRKDVNLIRWTLAVSLTAGSLALCFWLVFTPVTSF